MTHLPVRSAALASLMLALAAAAPAPVAAQAQPGTFSLPEPTPTPTPAPAGPADERAGVAIPPRAQPSAGPTPAATPTARPLPAPSASLPPLALPPAASTPTPRTQPAPRPEPAPLPTASGEASPAVPPQPAPDAEPLVPAAPTPPVPAPATASASPDRPAALPDWWPWAAGGIGVLALLGGVALLRRRRKPAVPRLAAPSATPREPAPASDLPRIDLTLEITSATRSLMMFTLGWRLTVANRSDRAANDVHVALELACARASAGNAPSAGRAQSLGQMPRIGPHQARSITGEVQLPLSAVQPLRQGATPLFVPLVHVTLSGDGLPAITRSFVVGPRSASGRVHPITLDQPPGSIAGLVAQAIAVPPASAAA